MSQWAFLAFLLLVAGCASTKVNLAEIEQRAAEVNMGDGVSNSEAIIIAQRFLLTTNEEPCLSTRQHSVVSAPIVKSGWTNPPTDYGVYVGFPRKGFQLFEVPLYIKVSETSGNASCAGYLVLK